MLRRDFLKNLSISLGGMALAAHLPLGVFAGDKRTVKGVVSAKGKGLAGVVVSDGYTVMPTDEKGRFEFVAHKDAVNVFVATPAGYHFLQETGITRNYEALSDNGAYNFELTPLDKDDNEHHFFVWADTQVKNKKDVKKLMTQTVPSMKNSIAALPSGALAHGITLGDIAWDDLAYFDDYSKAVGEIGLPFFQCLGNHDMDFNKGGEATSDDTFMKVFGPTYYSFNRGKVHYIVMDNVRYLGVDRNYDGYVLEHQLEWLKKDLSFVPQENLIVLCMHIPLFSHTLNAQDVLALLGKRKVHVMSGHTHYNENTEHGNVYEHNHGTVCGAWWTGPICGDGTPNGYAVYHVNGTDISWQYISTGKPANHQMKIWISEPLSDMRILQVNIWNFDAAWKTEYFVDGVSKGTLERYMGYDPDAYATLLGPEKPASRGFAEPHLNDHMFRANIPVNAGVVKVVVTDRFGNVYTAEKAVEKVKVAA